MSRSVLAVVAYDFTRDRRKARPLQYLEGCQGYVHADAYSGYDELFRRPGITEVGCWCRQFLLQCATCAILWS